MPARPTALIAVAAALAGLPATASAATYKVTSVKHSSSSAKTAEGYAGRSTAWWKLARPDAGANNKVSISRLGGLVTGLGTVNVSGAYGVDVSTDRPGSCAWVAPTGDRSYPLVAPERVILSFGPDPRDAGRTLATFTGIQATLANAYLPSECSTSVRGEPGAEQTASRAVSPRTLRRKRFTLRFRGSSAQDGITYAWSTTFRLVRAKRGR